MSYTSLTLVNSKLVLLVFQMRVLAHWRQSKWLSVVWAQSTSSSDVLLRILLFKTLGDNLTKFCTALGCRGLLIIYLEILCPPLKLISPGRLPQSDADNICYFSIIFCWLMMMKFSGDFSSLRPDKSSKMPSTTSPCSIIFRTLHLAQKESKLQIIRRWLWCSFFLQHFVDPIASLSWSKIELSHRIKSYYSCWSNYRVQFIPPLIKSKMDNNKVYFRYFVI